jgi:TPR repeat protein
LSRIRRACARPTRGSGYDSAMRCEFPAPKQGDPVMRALDEIVAAIIRIANDGDAMAQYKAGLLYELGHGVECNPTEALRWYRAAAAQNVVEAHFAIGFLLESGRIEDADEAAAWHWYSLAAAAGHCGARLRLCRMRAGPGRSHPGTTVRRWSRIAPARQ